MMKVERVERQKIKQGIGKLLKSSVRSTELLFGIQALTTGIMSLIKYCVEGHEVLLTSFIFMLLASLSSIPQIYGVISDRLILRHWTNFTTFIFTSTLSISLYIGNGETIAIFGYAGLSLASLYCFAFTSRLV